MTLLSRVAASRHLGVDRVPIANCTAQKCTESGTKTKEGEKEKRTWLRGLLLGIGMSLLLMGGVALAQGITITTDPEGCLERYEGELPNFLALRSSGSSATNRNAKVSPRQRRLRLARSSWLPTRVPSPFWEPAWRGCRVIPIFGGGPRASLDHCHQRVVASPRDGLFVALFQCSGPSEALFASPHHLAGT